MKRLNDFVKRLKNIVTLVNNSWLIATPAAMENADPTQWDKHHFGLSPERWKNLNGKAFWVTGAGTGYGKAIAVALAAAGAQIFLTGRRQFKLLETLDEMKAYGIPTRNCHLIEADICDPEQIKMACKKVENSCASLYGLVNNAALTSNGSFQNESPESWDRLMRTNVTAGWLLTREIFGHMSKGNSLRILFMTSGAGWTLTSEAGPYHVSKAALNSLGVSMAEKYAATYPDIDIQMNILDPGAAKTEMNPSNTTSPYSVVSMALILLSHPPKGPNGKFFHRNGRPLRFMGSAPYNKALM